MWCWIQENAVDLIGHLLTLVGIVAGAIVVAWQIARQHRSSLELQKRNAQEALKLEIYETLTERLRGVTHSNVKAMMYAFMIPSKIEIYQQHMARKIPVAHLVERAEEFSHLNKAAHDALIELIQEFEAWSIAFPEIELFQTALNSANHDARNASIALFNRLLTVLPTDPAPDTPPNVPRPIPKPLLDADQIAELKRFVEEYKRAMDDIGSYVFDLQIEAQNKLLSGLFDHRVPRRKPLDPNLKVISTEPAEMERLMFHFVNETPWGKEYRQYEAQYTKSAPKN